MNTAIFYFLYNFAHRSEIFDKVIIFFAVYFPFVVILFAILFLLFRQYQKCQGLTLPFKAKFEEVGMVILSIGAASIVSKVLKILIHAARPFDALPRVYSLFAETGFTFPSDHATFFLALAVSIFFINKKTGALFMFFALIIGLARIMAGVHFPIDILAGFILGALVACSAKYAILCGVWEKFCVIIHKYYA